LISSILVQAEKVAKKNEGSQTTPQSIPLTETPFDFNGSHKMASRFDVFMTACIQYKKEKSVLFEKPGVYLFVSNDCQLQGQSLSAFSETLIKGQFF